MPKNSTILDRTILALGANKEQIEVVGYLMEKVKEFKSKIHVDIINLVRARNKLFKTASVAADIEKTMNQVLDPVQMIKFMQFSADNIQHWKQSTHDLWGMWWVRGVHFLL